MTKVYQLLCLYIIFQQTCIHTNTLITCHVCRKSVTKRKKPFGNLIATSTNPNRTVPQHYLCTRLGLCTALHLLTEFQQQRQELRIKDPVNYSERQFKQGLLSLFSFQVCNTWTMYAWCANIKNLHLAAFNYWYR